MFWSRCTGMLLVSPSVDCEKHYYAAPVRAATPWLPTVGLAPHEGGSGVGTNFWQSFRLSYEQQAPTLSPCAMLLSCIPPLAYALNSLPRVSWWADVSQSLSAATIKVVHAHKSPLPPPSLPACCIVWRSCCLAWRLPASWMAPLGCLQVPGWKVGESNSATGRWIPPPVPLGIDDPVVR